MKVIALAASSSRHSINKQLVTYAASQIPNSELELIDINDYEMPLFSEDREKELGSPEQAQAFYKKLGEADALLIAFAEHNGSYTAAYKNLFDWTSRVDMKVFQNKPAVFLATSPGPGGAQRVLNTAANSAPHFGADLKAQLSVASFYDQFDLEKQEPKNDELKQSVLDAVMSLVN